MDRVTVLVVDDNPGMRHTLLRCLSGEDRSIVCVADGTEALRVARAQTPDLIILDVRMPGLSGTDVCRLLRADDRTRRIPILMLSSLVKPENGTADIGEGADVCMAKPFNVKALSAQVEALLRRSSDGEAAGSF